MIEQVFNYSTTDEKVIEMLIHDENLHYNHMVLNKDERLPEHFTNSNVYMTVVRGTLSIGLGEQEIHKYPKGSVLKIPNNIKMNVINKDDETLEIIVVKAPAPVA